MRKIFIIALGLGISLQTSVLAQRGSLESESETYNLDILKVKMNVSVLDADKKTPLRAKIEVRDVVEKTTIHESQPADGKADFILRRNKVYNLRLSAPKFEDSLIVLDLAKDVSTNQVIELNPKRTVIEINVSDMETGDGLPFGVTLTNKNRNEVIVLDPKDGNNGKYKVRLRDDDEYELEVKNPKDYIFYSNTVSSKKTAKMDVKLHTLTVGAKIPLYNITFETAKWDLNDNSRRELDRIVKLLKDNPTARIEIGAHTDDKGSASYNLQLSQKRAKSVFEYLVIKKIPAKRFVAKGYGKERPVASNDTEEGRAANRRFDLTVLSL